MEFNISKLSEITMNINRGVTPSYTEEGNCYVINQRCIRDNRIDLSLARKNDIKLRSINEDKLIKIGDTLINSTGVGTLGRVARVKKIKGILTCDSHVMIVRPNKNKIDPVYLSYYLFGMQSVIESMGRGSTGQTELSRIELGELKIKYPSYKEQIKIAKILSSIDDKIELNNKINNNLEELAQTLYKHWFVDFEFPNEEGLPYKSSGGKMVDSELGLIPDGWSISIITDIFDIQYGKYNYTKNKGSSNRTYPIYGANGIISYNDTYEHEERQIIVGCRGTCGNVSLTNEKSNITSNSLIFKSKLIPYNYFRLKNFNFSPYITGSTQPQITIKNVSGIKFINPTSNLITDFSDFSFSILKKIRTIEIENKKLEKLRDKLLPKLMSGEIRVPIKE